MVRSLLILKQKEILIGIFGKPGTGKSHAFTRVFEPYLRSINESKT